MENQLSLHLTHKNRKIKLPSTGVLVLNKAIIKNLNISEAYLKIYFSVIENNQLQKSKSKRLSFETYKTPDQKPPIEVLEFKDVQGKQVKIEIPKGFNDTELEVLSDHPFDITIEISHLG